MIISKNKSILIYLSIVIVFTSWIIFFTLPRDLQYIFFIIPAIGLIIHNYQKVEIKRLFIFILFSIVIFRYSLPSKIDITDPYLYASLLRGALIMLLFLIKTKDLIKIYYYVKYILTIILIVSLPFFIIYTIGIVNFNPISVYIGEEGEGRIWNVYWFFSLQYSPYTGEIVRYPAIFDEPGYLGTLLAFIMAIEKYNLSNNQNKYFLLCGMLTFSMAFYVLTIIYLLISKSLKFRHKFYTIILLIGIGLIIIQIFPDQFYSRIYSRIFDDQTVQLNTDYRIGPEAQYYAISILSDQSANQLLFGNGYDGFRHNNINLGTNWSRLVHQIGLVFFAIYIFIIIYLSWGKKNAIAFAIIFIASLLQRPAVFVGPIWTLLLICGLMINDK